MTLYKHTMTPDEEKELLAYTQAFDEAWKRATVFDEQQAMDRLDAYGHMNWTVGDEDYFACFDAVLASDGIAYHVVVNCESGGWIDTIEKAIVSLSEIDQLRGLPWRYADTCLENDVETSHEDVQQVADSWNKHLDSLLEQAEAGDGYAELRKAALNHRGVP